VHEFSSAFADCPSPHVALFRLAGQRAARDTLVNPSCRHCGPSPARSQPLVTSTNRLGDAYGERQPHRSCALMTGWMVRLCVNGTTSLPSALPSALRRCARPEAGLLSVLASCCGRAITGGLAGAAADAEQISPRWVSTSFAERPPRAVGHRQQIRERALRPGTTSLLTRPRSRRLARDGVSNPISVAAFITAAPVDYPCTRFFTKLGSAPSSPITRCHPIKALHPPWSDRPRPRARASRANPVRKAPDWGHDYGALTRPTGRAAELSGHHSQQSKGPT